MKIRFSDLKIGDYVAVVWYDASSSSINWISSNKIVNLTKVVSVGIYDGLHDFEGFKFVSLFTSEDELGRRGGMWSIPTACIKGIKKLK